MKRQERKKTRKRMKKMKAEKTMKKSEKMTMKKWKMIRRGKHREKKGVKRVSTCIIYKMKIMTRAHLGSTSEIIDYRIYYIINFSLSHLNHHLSVFFSDLSLVQRSHHYVIFTIMFILYAVVFLLLDT